MLCHSSHETFTSEPQMLGQARNLNGLSTHNHRDTQDISPETVTNSGQQDAVTGHPIEPTRADDVVINGTGLAALFWSERQKKYYDVDQ